MRFSDSCVWKSSTGLGVGRVLPKIACAVIAASVLWSGPGFADEPQQQAAAGHFERGVELYREGSLDAALVEFERAYEAVPDYRVLYNIAQVQSQRGEYVEAIEALQLYLRQGGDGIDAARRAEVDEDLSKLNGRVAKLWVESNAEGAEVFVNGKLAGVLPLSRPILVNAGVCDVRVSKSGFEQRSHQVKVAGGEQPRLSIPLAALAITAPSPAAGVRGAPESTPRTEVTYAPFWVSLAATAALGGASGGLGYLAWDAKQRMDDELKLIPADRALVEARAEDAWRLSVWADVCGAAAVVAGGTALFFLISPPSATTDDSVVGSLRVRTNGTSAVLSGAF